jgi:hypothetical protein
MFSFQPSLLLVLLKTNAQLTLPLTPGMFWERFGCEIPSISPEKFPHLKVHKRENFLGFDFEICAFS